MNPNRRAEILWIVSMSVWVLVVYLLITNFDVIRELPLGSPGHKLTIPAKSILLLLFILVLMLNGSFIMIKRMAFRYRLFRVIAMGFTFCLALFTMSMLFYYVSILDFSRQGLLQQLPGKVSILLFWSGLLATLLLRTLEIRKITPPR